MVWCHLLLAACFAACASGQERGIGLSSGNANNVGPGDGTCSWNCGTGECKDRECICSGQFAGENCQTFFTSYNSVTFKAEATVDVTGFLPEVFIDALSKNIDVDANRIRVHHTEASVKVAGGTSIYFEILNEQFATTKHPELYTPYGASMRIFELFDEGQLFSLVPLPYQIAEIQGMENPASLEFVLGIVAGIGAFLCCLLFAYKTRCRPVGMLLDMCRGRK